MGSTVLVFYQFYVAFLSHTLWYSTYYINLWRDILKRSLNHLAIMTLIISYELDYGLCSDLIGTVLCRNMIDCMAIWLLIAWHVSICYLLQCLFVALLHKLHPNQRLYRIKLERTLCLSMVFALPSFRQEQGIRSWCPMNSLVMLFCMNLCHYL